MCQKPVRVAAVIALGRLAGAVVAAASVASGAAASVAGTYD
jgi:hypothetical protein